MPPDGMGCGNVRDEMLSTSLVAPQWQHVLSPKTVSIIGAPMTYGQPYGGTDDGPALLREAGLLNQLTSLGWRVEDMPDLDFSLNQLLKNESDYKTIEDSDAKNSLLVGRGAYELAKLVESKILAGKFPLILGGDHSITMGSLAGILRAKPETGVLWIDAHADLNTPSTSESGNMHGMPIGMLMDEMNVNHASIPGCEWLAKPSDGDKDNNSNNTVPRIKPDSIVYIGLRDVDAEERRAIRELGICAYTMHDIDHYGIGRIMDMAMAHLRAKQSNRPIHLSFDIDAVDPALAPATGTAVRGGLTYREAHYIAEAAAKTGLLASADMVELNPTLSDGEGVRKTVGLGLRILTSLLGKSII